MPPSDRITTQHYPFATLGDGANVNPTPFNPQREYLLIQNNSVNPVELQFGRSAVNQPANYVIPGGGEKEWREKIPTGSLNFTSAVGETVTGIIIEGLPFVPPKNGRN